MCFFFSDTTRVYDRVYCVYQQQFYAVVYSEDDCAKVFWLLTYFIVVRMNKTELLWNACWIETDFDTAGAYAAYAK